MKGYLLLALFGCGLLNGCGGGAMSSAGAPQVSLSASSLGFGSELVGGISQPLSVTVTNSGTAPLNITSIVVGANFAETDTCSAPLAPRSNCTISVTFTPAASGNLAGTLSVTDNAIDSPQKVSLSGTASVGGQRCSVQSQECGAPQLPPCCPGLVCAAASTRAFCQPQ